MNKSIGIGLMGLGVVGSGVLQVLTDKADSLAEQIGCPLRLRRILIRDLKKKRAPQVPLSLLTTDPQQLFSDPEIDIVIELVGGDTYAYELIKQALLSRKHVITANKDVIARYGPDLITLASNQGVDIRHEASVGGGIPIINPFKHDFVANRISAIHAIINGTTNYIVTRMTTDNIDFETALGEAQQLGYAEPNPTNDIDGIDAAYKLAILATLAFHTPVRPGDVYHEGVSSLSARDFRYAGELGYAIKLLAIAKEQDNRIQARVHPVFVPQELLLAKVNGVFNAVQVEGDLTGKVIFYGQGAGSFATSSAIISDLVHVAQNIHYGLSPKPQIQFSVSKSISPISELWTRYYMRMTVDDRPGVLAQILKIFGDHSISIASVIQKEADESAQTAEIVIMTHTANESAVQEALRGTRTLPVVREISSMIRVED